jgi:surfactin family lipopeptide synthetase B/lichenysin synthetase B
MIPFAFVSVDSLPLTANGKVDRRALPAPGDASHGAEQTFSAPETPIQEELARIWQDVLRVDRVGIDDDFFALGGHSMLALSMLGRVQAALGADMALGAVFERPTIRALAEAVTMALLGTMDGEDLDDLLVGTDS